MANTNDQKIMELKKQIEEKKVKVAKAQKFTPVTNCSLEIDGARFNIHTLNKDTVVTLLVRLNSYAMSAKELDLIDEYFVSGYHVMEWITDLKAKLDNISRKDEEQKLKAMETKLDKLLSNEKKVELEISEIESLLKE